MKRKLENLKEIEINQNPKLLAKFYNLNHFKTETSELFTSKTSTNSTLNPINYQIFIHNLPSNLTQEQLLLILLKPKTLQTLKLIKTDRKTFGFVNYSNETDLNLICDLLNHHEQVSGALNDLKARKCTTKTLSIYISNLKIKKLSFYKIQAVILKTLIGLKRIVFYSLDKYGRYCLKLDFFESFQVELGLELLQSHPKLFRNYPEVILDTKVVNFRNYPVLVFEWDKEDESRLKRPKIGVLNRLEARNLAAF